MKRLFISILCAGLAVSASAQDVNKTDAKKRKQGPWVEQVESIRGEPGYSWEGVYKNDRKEGVWKKYTINGDLMAEETFLQGALQGLCKYYYPNGKISATGQMIAIDLEGQKDTVVTIDPVSGEESLMEVVRKGNSVRQGEWRLYDEDGNMVRETYERGELSSSAQVNRPRNTAPLPHEAGAAGKKKKGKD
ncbi:toxin-antitoxin system YwqK family antitoxin [Chitinophaga lutea]